MAATPIDAYLERLHERWRGERSGAVADYIPPLALADPDWFGIAVATTDGHCYEVGESRREFTIQSISKPFTYGIALQEHGFAPAGRRRRGAGAAGRRGLRPLRRAAADGRHRGL